MKIIGLTGELCSGKTTVAGLLKDMGGKVIDADLLVHRLYKTDKVLKKSILKAFGKGVFTGGEIDRAKLGEMVFNKKAKLGKLCRLVHPEVIKKIKIEAKAKNGIALVIDAPLLIESGLHKIADYLIVVKADRGEELQRCQRKGLSKQKAYKILNVQMSAEKKIKYADFIIYNNGSKSDLRKQITRIWRAIMTNNKSQMTNFGIRFK